MEIHRFEKVWLVAALVLIVALIATVTYGALGAGVTMVEDDGGTVDPAAPAESENFREPGVYETGQDEYAVYIIARRFAFQPGSTDAIRVPANSRVTFYVTSGDVVHGFNLAGTNVNSMAIPGQVAQMTVEFDEPGEYDIICHEYCGAAHHDMVGKLVVVPQSEYEGGSQ